MPFLQKRIFLIIAFMVFQSLAGIMVGLVFASTPGENTVFPGVFIGGVDVGGLSRAEVDVKLRKMVTDNLEAGVLVFQHGDRQWPVAFTELRVEFDIEGAVDQALNIGRQDNVLKKPVLMFRAMRQKQDMPMKYTLDKQAVLKVLKRVGYEINKPARNVSIKINDSKIMIEPDSLGQELDIDSNIRKIKEVMGDFQQKIVMLEVKEIRPSVTASQLKEIKNIIGLGVTAFPTMDRMHTEVIKLTVKTLNGTLVQPGEVFSFNKALEWSVYNQGLDVSCKITGETSDQPQNDAVCQAAGTLYQAVLYSGLEIVERHAHFNQPRYIGAGQDAMVAPEKLDLKFRNTTRYPIYLHVSIKDKRVIINLLGVKKTGQTIQLIATETITSSGSGKNVKLYRVYYNHGVEVKRELISDDNFEG